MIKIYLYLFLLLLMVFLGRRAWLLNSKESPYKIKLFNYVIIIILILRYMSLGVLFAIQNLNYIYYIQPALHTDLVTVPLILVGCYYIFFRNEKFSFNYNFIVLALLSIFYIYTILSFKTVFKLNKHYLYVSRFSNEAYIYLVYAAIIAVIMSITMFTLGKPNSNSKGLFMILITSIILISETFMYLLGISLLDQRIFGEVFALLTLNYGLGTFKKAK